MSVSAPPVSAPVAPRVSIQERLGTIWSSVADFWQDRTKHMDLFDEYVVDGAKTNPWLSLGAMAYFFWICILVSGFFLVIYYIPTTYRAYNSIHELTHHVFLGGWMRGVHKYGADAFLVAMILRIYRMYYTAEHRKPRELTYCIAILLLMFGMFSGLTGYLLIWNQRAYWATKVFATFPTYLNEPYFPGIHQGTLIAQIMLGGMGIGPATITRFYAGHYALSALLLITVEVHFYRRGLRRLNLSSFMIWVCVAMLLVVTAILPTASGAPADPSQTPEHMLSDWYFLGLYHLYRIQDPFWATVFTMPGLPAAAMLVAWWDRRGGKRPTDRPFTFVLGTLVLIYWLLFTALIMMGIANKRQDPIITVFVATVVLLFGAWWEVNHFKKKPGTPRPFPTMLDGTVALSAVVVICYLIYPFQTNVLITKPGSDVLLPVHDIVTNAIQNGWKQASAWLLPFPTIGQIMSGQLKYNGWWDAVIRDDNLNMSFKFYQWVFLTVALAGFSWWDIRVTRRLARGVKPAKPEPDPADKGHPDVRYALFLAFFFVCLFLVSAFGLIAEKE